jgi:TolB-like protein/Tfp pilus assembly protein PilF
MGETFPHTPPSAKPPEDRLDSWKEIAAYLNRDVTTVQRWEKREGMPVHRHVHDKLGSVYASRAELDAWARGRKPQSEAENGYEAPSSNAAAPAITSGPKEGLRGRIKVAGAAAALAVVVALTAFAIYRATRASSGENQGRLVIAVVPLENLSGDPGQDFFANGLTEEVITQLGQLNPEKIGVVRYGSSATARQGGSLIAELRQRAGLQYLLEGSVRRQEEQARISIRLVRVADETTVWTESYDRNVGDVLALQSEIAHRVGSELQIRVLPRANRKSVEPVVVESYFKGRFEMARLAPPISDAPRAYFQQAITLDPSYAPAYAGLADFYCSRASGDAEVADESWRLAEQYATKALSLDSESAEAHIAMAQIKLLHDWDWPAAREHALRALQLNPSSPEAHGVYARYLRTAGNVTEALNHRRQAVALDPVRGDLNEKLTFEHYFARDYQFMVTAARQKLASDPNDLSANVGLCVNLARLEQFDEAVAECDKSLGLEGHADWVTAYEREYHEHGYMAASLLIARKNLNEIKRQPHPDLWDLANAYVAAGMKDEALNTLFEGLKMHEPGLLQIRVDPDFDSIRSDPRYAELVRQIGFPTE